MSYFRKLNNAALWDNIRKLRKSIKLEPNFKERVCWNCKKELNIYDFLSDNIELSHVFILSLWQNRILEFHCCECFKNLKSHELKSIERELKIRHCTYCKSPIDLYKFNKYNNYLKIYELKNVWLNIESPIYCDNLCQRKHYSSLRSNVRKFRKSKKN